MADLLQQGSAWLETQRTKHLTRPVVYRRGAQSLQAPATIGRTVFELDKGYGLTERIESRDYLMLTADLAFGGTRTEPQPGDVVAETEGDKTFLYEVMAPGNEPCWRHSDPFRRTFRIHTKFIGLRA